MRDDKFAPLKLVLAQTVGVAMRVGGKSLRARCLAAGKSVVCQHADHNTLRIANEEATYAPGLVNWTVDDLVPAPDCFSVGRIDGFARIDVHAHVGQRGLYSWRCEDDLRLAGPEADVPPPKLPSSRPSTRV